MDAVADPQLVTSDAPLRVAITGAGGYIGSRVLTLLRDDPRAEHVLGIDVRPWRGQSSDPCEHLQLSVTDPGLAGILRQHRINALLHLAFILNPIHDEREMHRINVDGTRRVLDACVRAGVGNIVVASSGVVYGAKPQSRGFLTEESPVDEGNRFSYTAHKVEVERLLVDFCSRHADVSVKWIRPCVVIGPHLENYLSRYLQKPLVFSGSGCDPEMQFVHEDDVAAVFRAALGAGAQGPFNACGDGVVTFSELAALFGKRVIPVPRSLLRVLTSIGWRLRLSLITESPPELLDYILFPWVMSTARIRSALGFEFRYNTRQAIQSYVDAHPALQNLPRF